MKRRFIQTDRTYHEDKLTAYAVVDAETGKWWTDFGFTRCLDPMSVFYAPFCAAQVQREEEKRGRKCYVAVLEVAAKRQWVEKEESYRIVVLDDVPPEIDPEPAGQENVDPRST